MGPGTKLFVQMSERETAHTGYILLLMALVSADKELIF